MWGMHYGDMGWGWGLFGAAWMVLFWGSIIALVVWVVSRLSRGNESRGSELTSLQTPLEIAKTRYAKGEITREEFEQIKGDLS